MEDTLGLLQQFGAVPTPGAARPDLCLGTPELVASTRLKHRLEVVRVADHLLRADRQARWLTERQLRHAQGCDTCVANRRAWGRRPDGVLISGGQETAIEVETTAKPLDQDLAILDAYADQGVPSHWYVVPPIAQERIVQAAAVPRRAGVSGPPAISLD